MVERSKSPKFKYKKTSTYIYFVIALLACLTRTTYVRINEIVEIFEEKVIGFNLVIVIAVICLVVEVVRMKKYKCEGDENGI
ncbi:MAG: hypothetical protein ACRDAU_05955 [Clostridium sp.]